MRPILIVGGGLAGMMCARALQKAGRAFLILEAAEALGGRVRTDRVDGFRLDRGFQVLLTAYPETQKELDYTRLDLRPFYPGALIRFGGKFHKLADPWRRFFDGLGSVFNPIGTPGDKLKVGQLRASVRQGTLETLMALPEITTLERLRRAGLSATMIDRFFRPFLGGVFFERDLTTSSRMFDFVFRLFSQGEIALPNHGMQAIADQLASILPQAAIRLNAPVAAVTDEGVVLASGESIAGAAVVVATEAVTAARLLGTSEQPPWRGTTCLYFTAPKSPITLPILVLDGEGTGPINNLCVPTDVAPGYGPEQQALISASTIGIPDLDDVALENGVRAQLGGWFGTDVVKEWRLLRIQRIRAALPNQDPPFLAEPSKPVRLRPRLYAAGDWRDTASINGAMAAGRRAAEALLLDLPADS